MVPFFADPTWKVRKQAALTCCEVLGAKTRHKFFQGPSGKVRSVAAGTVLDPTGRARGNSWPIGGSGWCPGARGEGREGAVSAEEVQGGGAAAVGAEGRVSARSAVVVGADTYVRGVRCGQVTEEILRRLLVVAVSDPLPGIRQELIKALDSRFDEFLCQTHHLQVGAMGLGSTRPSCAGVRALAATSVSSLVPTATCSPGRSRVLFVRGRHPVVCFVLASPPRASSVLLSRLSRSTSRGCSVANVRNAFGRALCRLLRRILVRVHSQALP